MESLKETFSIYKVIREAITVHESSAPLKRRADFLMPENQSRHFDDGKGNC